MKRILGGRHTKASKSSNVAGSKDVVKVQESRLLKTSVTPSSSTQISGPSRKVLGVASSAAAPVSGSQRLVPSNP